MSDDPARARLLAVAARRLRDGSSPRLTVGFFLFLAGLVGFVASVVMLRLGLDRMAIRYPLAVGCGYLAFLGCLGAWLSGQRGDGDGATATALDVANAALQASPRSSRVRLGEVGDVDAGDSGGLVVAVLVTVAVVAVIVAAAYAVVAAPSLLAELLVDAAVVGALPRKRHWTRTAVARTGWVAAVLAAVFGLVGAGLEAAAPGAHTLGQAMGFGGAK